MRHVRVDEKIRKELKRRRKAVRPDVVLEPHKPLKLRTYRQREAFCGPSSIKIASSYFGHDFDELEIGKKCGTTVEDGTDHEGMIDGAEKLGAMVYADLDRFKTLNDKLGHPAGDAALMHFARIIREQIRSGDAAARIGGEEFAVWLPGTGLDLGARIAERIRLKLGTTPWDWRGQAWPLSASFGVAACPETAATIGELLGQADAALYVAKNSGRNRVERAGRR